MANRAGYERRHNKDKHVCVAQGPTSLDYSNWKGNFLYFQKYLIFYLCLYLHTYENEY